MELRKVSLPTYRIEPPDVISIDMPRLVPLPPYRAEVYDVLMIHVSNALSDQPIEGYFMVEAEGVVNLGPAYGSVRVVGMTLEESKKAIEASLGRVVREPEVAVQLARVYGAQQVSGQYLVGPDGTINLRQYGVVHVAGLTVTETRLALQRHLAQLRRFAAVVGGRDRLQQQDLLRDHAGCRHGGQLAAFPHHGQRDGAGRGLPDQRAVADFQHEDLDCPAGARHGGLRARSCRWTGRRSRNRD